ncbi:MAG: aminotransferase class V-fold PLP-dependent enzyme [Planctomycetota bacterium]|nr:aminotransferase class V-fold PLP-dependent enzyme [Planctomycetota bacterium]
MPLWPRRTYLDHNASTPLAPQVRRAMAACLKNTHGNPSSLHIAGRSARGAVERARRSVAALLGCQSEDLYFTSGGTEANNAVIKGVWSAAGGGHVVTTRIEHDSVLGACGQVEKLGGRVTYVPAGADGRVNPRALADAIRPDTVLVSVMHANNETGAIQPVGEIAALARQAGVPFHTDAVQTFGKIPTRVDDLGCEFLTLTAHKINGPKGAGALYWRGNARWTPLIAGGDQERRMRTGTEAVHQIVGLGAAADLAARGMDGQHPRLAALRKMMIDGIGRLYPSARINEAPEGWQMPGSVNATFPGKSGLSILAGLDCHQVAVSIGSACTADRIEPSHVLLGMGLSEADALSTVRVSMGATTVAADVKYFLWALQRVLRGDPEGLAWLPPEHLTAERIAGAFLIDLRLRYERMIAPGVPGAKLWSHIGIEKRFREIPRDREVILMCTTGIFSFEAGYRLADAGHPRVRVVYGGYEAWKALYPDLLERLRSGPD